MTNLTNGTTPQTIKRTYVHSRASERAPADSAVFQVDPDDEAPTYLQIERRIRIAVADGTLMPGAPLPSVRDVARQMGISPNTVGRAYADLSREGVIVGRAGGGSAIASRDQLDEPALQRTRLEGLHTLARQAAVRGLALGFDAAEIAEALRQELALHGHPLPPTVAPRPLGRQEVPLLSARNRLAGKVSLIRAGELVAEVTLELPPCQLVAAITRASLDRLGFEPGCRASAYVKASEITLGR